MLTRAAGAASALFDHDLAVRLASAALDLGAGSAAALALAGAEACRNRFAAAEAASAPWEAGLNSEADAKAYVAARVPLLRWGLDRPDEADALLHRAEAWIPRRSWRQYLRAWAVELHQDAGRINDAARFGRALLKEANLEPETQLVRGPRRRVESIPVWWHHIRRRRLDLSVPAGRVQLTVYGVNTNAEVPAKP